MTEKLYRADSYATKFQAKVLTCDPRHDGVEMVLDKTLFYPTAGGQLHDTGTLAGMRVIDVRESKVTGQILHVLSGAEIIAPSQVVHGEIDWSRRFDHMQQHTGEHMLGQAFFKLGLHVEAVNMEHAVCTLDLSGDVTPKLAREAEENVNAQIYAAHKITTYEIEDLKISELPLRRAPKVFGMVRVVQIGDYDYSACGGTHLHNSSEVGIIKILRLERSRGGLTRVHFICGLRAFNDYSFKHDFVGQLALRFSTAPENVPDRALAVLDALAQSRNQLNEMRAKLAAALLDFWLTEKPNEFLVRQVEDADLVLELAKNISTRPGCAAAFVAQDEARIFLAVGCATDTDKNANDIVKAALVHVEGKGGGKPELAQGSGTKQEGLADLLSSLNSI